MNLNKTSLALIAFCTLISGCSSSGTPPAETPETPMDSDPPMTPEPQEDPENSGIENEDPLTPESTMLIPSPETGSDTDRLLKGINRQVARTLLDLNARLSEGTDLTDQQNICLGSYDPAAGRQLLAIACEGALATGEVPITVALAAYYDTPECHASIFNGDVDNCQLESASLSIPIDWITPERPADTPTNVPNRPQPTAGVALFYAINSTNLRIESNEADEIYTGRFQCDINLLTNETSAPILGQSCANTIELAANHFDTLLPE